MEGRKEGWKGGRMEERENEKKEKRACSTSPQIRRFCGVLKGSALQKNGGAF